MGGGSTVPDQSSTILDIQVVLGGMFHKGRLGFIHRGHLIIDAKLQQLARVGCRSEMSVREIEGEEGK